MIIIRRRAEEAREALRLGLERVRLIQEQAQCVPQLQSRIAQLESELQEYRYKHHAWSFVAEGSGCSSFVSVLC